MADPKGPHSSPLLFQVKDPKACSGLPGVLQDSSDFPLAYFAAPAASSRLKWIQRIKATCVSQEAVPVIHHHSSLRVVAAVSTVIAARWDAPRRVQVGQLGNPLERKWRKRRV